MSRRIEGAPHADDATERERAARVRVQEALAFKRQGFVVTLSSLRRAIVLVQAGETAVAIDWLRATERYLVGLGAEVEP